MYGDQRPVAPWADHNWWGQYDDPGQFPNVAGAVLQMNNEVQAGDMAWSLFDQQLYVCIDGTLGAAVWQPVFMGLPDTTPVDLYVAADAATANDAGPGTIAEPLATLDQAIYRINNRRIITAPIIVHVAPAAAAYTWGATLGPVLNSQPIVIIGDGAGQGGDGFTVLRASAAAAAGTGRYVVVDPVGGMTVDAYEGKTIEILDGAAAGDRRTISTNSATDFVPAYPFSAAVAPGDSFRIVESSVVIQHDGTTVAGEDGYSVLGVGTPGLIDSPENTHQSGDNPASLLLVNFQLTLVSGGLSTFKAASSAIFVAGVEVTKSGPAYFAVSENSQFVAGIDRVAVGDDSKFAEPFILGLAASDSAWVGWGVFFNTVNNTGLSSFSGFMMLSSGAPSFSLPNARWWVMGGRIRGRVNASSQGFLLITNSHIALYGLSLSLPVILVAQTTFASAAAVRVVNGGELFFANATVTLTGNGVTVVAANAAGTLVGRRPQVSIYTNVGISGVRALLGVDFGGTIYYDAVTALTVPSVAECIVTQGGVGGAAVASSTLAGLANGAVISNPGQADNSIIGRIT